MSAEQARAIQALALAGCDGIDGSQIARKAIVSRPHVKDLIRQVRRRLAGVATVECFGPNRRPSYRLKIGGER
ncbi:hypothetical protein [Blastochloris tepida]|uniref:Uncharacterized protein n=1 Tax=Blastochloris tepida TaxID=2233851 RepID=A0A348FZD7_9HYPH|nr:hypothetical protein [Blastochloris tepida]BBF92670.1 hypothetical protein BLTE_13550 [Blastochloris tepida]